MDEKKNNKKTNSHRLRLKRKETVWAAIESLM